MEVVVDEEEEDNVADGVILKAARIAAGHDVLDNLYVPKRSVGG